MPDQRAEPADAADSADAAEVDVPTDDAGPSEDAGPPDSAGLTDAAEADDAAELDGFDELDELDEFEDGRQTRSGLEAGSLVLPLSPVGADRVRWMAIAAAGATAIALWLAGASGFAALVGVTLAASLVLAWAWPVLGGSHTPQATWIVLALAAVAIVPTAYREDLRWTSAAVALGIVMSFFAQLLRRTGRAGLVLTLLASFGGLVPMASATSAVVVTDTPHGSALLYVAMAAAIGALVADLLAGTTVLAPFLGLVALATSVVAALVAASVLGVDAEGVRTWGSVGVAAAVGTVSWSFRRVVALQPAMATVRGQVAAGVGSVLITGVLVRLFTLVS